MKVVLYNELTLENDIIKYIITKFFLREDLSKENKDKLLSGLKGMNNDALNQIIADIQY